MIWRMLDLFSGIGGFSLAAEWCWGDELEIVAFCEIDKFCQKVLKKHWPNVPIIEDVRDVRKEIIANCKSDGLEVRRLAQQESSRQPNRNSKISIDLLTGGFPCQPFSIAGNRKGKEDNRFLWPEMFAVIKEIKPHWIVVENVAGIVRMALDDCLSDLEGEDYSTQAVIIPACAVNAPHRRDRVWIVANSINNSNRTIREQVGEKNSIQEVNRLSLGSGMSCRTSQAVADSDTEHIQEYIGRNKLGDEIKERSFGWSNPSDRRQWSVEPDVGRVAHGIPNRVDRLKSLGDAIVPQVAYQIFKAIKEIENR